MSIVKGIISRLNPITKNVTVTEDADKIGLDVTILNASDVGVPDGDTIVNTRSGETDEGNSTALPLASGASFTGLWTSRADSTLIMAGAADQDFTFIAQFSNDGMNVDSNLTYTYTVGEINVPRRLVIAREYYRIVVMNTSGSAMTYLRFQTSVGEYPALTSKLNASMSLDADAAVSRSVIAGLSPSGTYNNVKVNAANALNTADFMLGVAQGDFAGYAISTVFGSNPDIDTGPEDIWANGGTYTGQPLHSTSAETLTCFSSSINDAAAGSGARTIRITGLDASWEEQTEDVTLNGILGVATALTWRRVFKVEVLTAGSGAQNAGAVTARHTTTTANVFAVVPATMNHSAIGAYTVPAGKTMYIVRLRAAIVRSSGSAGSAQYTIRVREENSVYKAIRNEGMSTSFPSQYDIRGALILTEKTDIKIRCTSVSDTNTQFSAAFEYLLIDNI